ncbi:MAG: hypothetical protein OXF11_12660 [Deltaproteobacteria bacterium]|nr:hypothetical protein [Deltaproteobacteria bacterium]
MAKADKKAKQPLRKPTVKVKPSSYQPSKAELEADMSIKATPRQLAAAVLATVEVRDEDA